MGNPSVTKQTLGLKDQDGGVLGTRPRRPTGLWVLPDDNYIPAKMPMSLVFPRDSESNTWAYGKNAYPGLEWSIRIDVQGGAWPFKYEILDNGGATGLTIGEELTRSIDGPTGLTSHTTTESYGQLKLPSPSTGSHSILLRVTDQDNNTLKIPINLTVGITDWLFVDPVGGNDTTGTGLIGAPFKTIGKIHNDSSATTTFSGQRVILRAGTTLLDGMTANNDNLRLVNDNNPVVYVGHPGEACILEAYEGWFVLDGAEDFYLGGDITYQYGSSYSPGGGTVPIYMINAVTAMDRLQVQQITFNDFKGTPFNSGAGNTSIIFLNSVRRNHISVTGNTLTGITGSLVDWFQTTNWLIEYNKWDTTTITTEDGSSRAVIFPKDSNETGTMRNNEMFDTLTWVPTNNYGGMGIHGQNGAVNVEECWNTIKAPYADGIRAGAIYNWANNADSALISGIFAYRNSLDEAFDWEGTTYTNFANGAEVHENNVLNTGTMPSDVKITSTGNIDGATYLDSNMKLTGASRTTYLGTKGAEVAS